MPASWRWSRSGGQGRIVVVCARTSRSNAQAEDPQSCRQAVQATGTGKFLRRRAFRNHLLDHKSPKQKRHLATKAVDRTDESA